MQIANLKFQQKNHQQKVRTQKVVRQSSRGKGRQRQRQSPNSWWWSGCVETQIQPEDERSSVRHRRVPCECLTCEAHILQSSFSCWERFHGIKMIWESSLVFGDDAHENGTETENQKQRQRKKQSKREGEGERETRRDSIKPKIGD